MKKFLIYILTTLLLFGCKDDEDYTKNSRFKELSYKVAVILPGNEHDRWKVMADEALKNITLAQKDLNKKVNIELKWYDENSSELKQHIKDIANDTNYVAVIGPRSSDKAEIVVPLLNDSKKPVILPILVSEELQRIYANLGYVWFLTKNDSYLIQCMMLESQISNRNKISVITGTTSYCKTYTDFVPYFATELNMEIGQIRTYKNDEELKQCVTELYKETDDADNRTIIFAPATHSDMIVMDEVIGDIERTPKSKFPKLVCSSKGYAPILIGKLKNLEYEGYSPSHDPESGFASKYKAKFNRFPMLGEAQLYDAISMVTYALAYTRKSDIKDGLKKIATASTEEENNEQDFWDSSSDFGMYMILKEINEGRVPAIYGLIGEWTFDQKHKTAITTTSYCNWLYADNDYRTLQYITFNKNGKGTPIEDIWQRKTLETFDEHQIDYNYPPYKDAYAVIISTSADWINYRHQADALAMYQLLKRNGYDDDHIILITEDNIAYHSKNPYPGVVKIRPDGNNLYTDVHVDYNISDISIEDLDNIMNGRVTDKTPVVLNTTENDNVFFFWSGHGEYNYSYKWGNSSVSVSSIKNIIERMSEEKRFRKMFMAVETCYSGGIGQYCTGIPGVLVMTAANEYETSISDMWDPVLYVYLSNDFTRAFQDKIDINPNISINDLYLYVARSTVQSHVKVYNIENFGNLYLNSMSEFIVKK